MFEANENAVVKRAYVTDGKEIIALQSTDGQMYWNHTDHLGTAKKMTDVYGNVIYSAHYDPFGAPISEWAASGNLWLNTHKFTGYERDAGTGLDYARARTYSAGLGRFMQADPLGSGHKGAIPQPLCAGNVRQPQSLNRYSYANNDPLNATDSTGLSSCFDDFIDCGLAVSGYLGSHLALASICGGTAGTLCAPSLALYIFTHPFLVLQVANDCSKMFKSCGLIN